MYDTIIVGAGPAGLTAAIYASRRNLKTLVLSKNIGGQASLAAEIENYPGVLNKPSGFELMQNFKTQAENLGAEIKYEGVNKIEKDNSNFKVTADQNIYQAKTVILALGLAHRELEVKGEEKLKGRGVAYCATCDGPLFKNKTVAVVGGGNSALDAADYLSGLAKNVYLIHRRDKFSAESIREKKVRQSKNITIFLNVIVKEIKGQNKVESIIVEDLKDKSQQELKLNGLFIEIGYQAKTGWLKNIINLNDKGEIITDENCCTSAPGVYAAGDVTDAPYKQIIISAGEGAKVALQAHQYLQQKTDHDS